MTGAEQAHLPDLRPLGSMPSRHIGSAEGQIRRSWDRLPGIAAVTFGDGQGQGQHGADADKDAADAADADDGERGPLAGQPVSAGT
jgi:hypothetical protein